MTADLKLHGWTANFARNGEWGQVYGSDLPELDRLAEQNSAWSEPLNPQLPFRKVEVIWAVTHEMARTVEDVLARRTRALFLDARASLEAAPEVARLMAETLGRDERWQAAASESVPKRSARIRLER